jgi:RNA polymerase sigma-70 factor (ECF subfamily)
MDHRSATRPDPEDIDRLILRAQGGDHPAFDAVVRTLHPFVRLTVAAHAIHADQVEEIIQEAWVRAYERLGTYEPRGTFLAWVKGIARNRLLEDLRERRRLHQTGDGDRLDRLRCEDAMHGLESGNEQHERLLARLGPCLEALDGPARAILIARDRDDEDLAGLARRFKRTREALATALWRIRATVRRCLEQA